MLPTMGLYKNIDCPYYENKCSRPYCHFRHRKKNQDIEPTATATTEIPTYNPTPKSQLANVRSHIPISYVPDLAVRSENSSYRINSFNDKKFPVYKPTPLSILSTGKTVGADEATNEKTANGDSPDNDTNTVKEPEPVTPAPEEVKKEKPKSNKKNDNKDDKKSRSKSKHRHDSKKDSRSSRHKSKKEDKNDKNKQSRKRSRSKSKDRHKSRHKEKHKSRDTKKREEKVKEDDLFDDSEVEDIVLNFDELEEHDDDTMEECYKIFNEYRPSQPEIFPETPKPIEENPVKVIKKRIAHENVDKNKPKTFNTVKSVAPTAAQVMVNRYKAIKQMQLENEKKVDVIAEITKQLKRPSAERAVEKIPVKHHKIIEKRPSAPTASTSLVDDIISGKQVTSKPRRIAPVQNVNSIQRAKEKIQEMAKQKAATVVKTSIQSISKGAKRVAHAPEVSISDVPEVLEAERSKLPVNVRSRYLSMIFDECVKLYISTEDAQQRAVTEEYKVYERCSALVTYRNSAMLAINRLRKELQEREAAGLGLILPGDSGGTNKEDGSDIKGLTFYKNIKQYILNEDELVQHGFPREGSKPGKAVVPNQKHTPDSSLDEFDRVCCRCSKIYRIDEDGFAIYEEECVYHPLKKRTFRGESYYLCCKSGEGSGCVTAPTHVCDTLSSDDEIDGFQATMTPERDNDPRSIQVFALDCEMCYTTKGLELTRVTIVNAECQTVYETLVKPFNPIIDYNTRFSGITKEQMSRTATSILQVQANILHLCDSNTILIGHSLESDMKALKIIHSTIIDTSILFPHKFGLPHKRALRDLAREYLKKIIQNDVSGHDSAEDALTCMELVQWKVKESLKVRGVKT